MIGVACPFQLGCAKFNEKSSFFSNIYQYLGCTSGQEQIKLSQTLKHAKTPMLILINLQSQISRIFKTRKVSGLTLHSSYPCRLSKFLHSVGTSLTHPSDPSRTDTTLQPLKLASPPYRKKDKWQ
jgi:hypothetical protein